MSKSQKVIPIEPEEMRYKKKSNNAGTPRSKHKHEYKTVLLHHEYSMSKPHDTNSWQVSKDVPTKVCVVCGRIAECDIEYYTDKKRTGVIGKFPIFTKELTPEAYDLEKWEVREYWGKFATKCEETEPQPN